jgi:hypothetical protein
MHVNAWGQLQNVTVIFDLSPNNPKCINPHSTHARSIILAVLEHPPTAARPDLERDDGEVGSSSVMVWK